MTTVIAARFANAQSTQITVTLEGGAEWLTSIDGDGQIVDAVKAWIAKGNTPTSYSRPAVSPIEVNAERDRRISVFPFNGKLYDFDGPGRENVQGAFSMASAALLAGAEAGNLRWSDPSYDFSWITKANEIVPMDAHQVVAFGMAAAAWKSAHIFRARALKDMNPIPLDFANDSHWPSS